MAATRSTRLNYALVSMGMVALVAGCGGGGGGASAPPGTYVPPVNKQMTTATLNLTVPGRRPSARQRSPQYVSPYTSRVDISAVAAGAPSPWPVATSTSIPTPGPVASGATPSPIPVTMTVPVAVGSDQFLVNTYDSGGYLLSGLASGPITIQNNAANNVNLVLNAAADCVQINHATGGSFTMTPLENQTGAQTATFVVTPCDADGYPIPAGQNLSNAITFATPAPVQVVVNSHQRKPLGAGPSTLTFDKPTITQGGDTTVTVTYPASGNTAIGMQAAPSPLPPSLYGGYGSVTADPVFMALIPNQTDNTVSVFVQDVAGTQPFTSLGYLATTGPGPEFIVGGSPTNGCAQGGQALVLNANTTTTVLTEPTPSASNPTPLPNAVAGAATVGNPAAVAIDSSCNVYEGDSTKYVSKITSQMQSTWTVVGGNYRTNGTGTAASITALGIAGAPGVPGANLYVGLGASGLYSNPTNIFNAPNAGTDQGVGWGTQAMVRYDANSMVIAYQPSPGGDAYLAQFTPGVGLSSVVDLGYASQSYPIVSMAVDPYGAVWAVSAANSSTLYQYNPTTGSEAAYSISASNTSIYSPTGIAVGPNGLIYVTDAEYSPGTVNVYSAISIAGGAPSSNAALLGTYPVGSNPRGVAIVP